MACVIAAPASGSGKTLLSLLLASWARHRKLKLQSFKVGPDYLDPQQLSAVSQKPCRNLDLILCGSHWVRENFYKFSEAAELVLVEGVMGLFDGVGSSSEGSTAALAHFLELPIVLVVDARGQAASLAALVKGFRDQDPRLQLAGVVLNHVNSLRHKTLLAEVLETIDVKMLGCMPNNPQLNLTTRHLGLAPAHEIEDLEERIRRWALLAEINLDLKTFEKLLKPPKNTNRQASQIIESDKKRITLNLNPIAIAEDQAFHFRYPETKEYLEELGIPCLKWKPIEDEPIPKEAKGLIIPGGFPEQYSEQISKCKRSMRELRVFFGSRPIYAECGGMLMLGETLSDFNGHKYSMAGLLPFHAQKGILKVGYRNIKSKIDSPIVKKDDELIGHEFHRWELIVKKSSPNSINNFGSNDRGKKVNPLWEVKGWETKKIEEGWGNKMFHASWIHLHWPSSPKILESWLKALKQVNH